MPQEIGVVDIQPIFARFARVRNDKIRQFLAEILATFLLCFGGIGAIAVSTFSNGSTSSLAVPIGFGFGGAMGIIASGKVSGAHMNPAVSLAFFLTGRLSIVRFILYVSGQLLGAFVAALAVFTLYIDQLKSYGPDQFSMKTASIFATYPNDTVSVFGAFWDQTVSTAIFVLYILSFCDTKNSGIPTGAAALLFGTTITVMAGSAGFNCGGAINPARDFGPRFFTLIAGWGWEPFQANSHFFWIPIVGPMFGAVLGTVVYILLISNHWPTDDESITEVEEEESSRV